MFEYAFMQNAFIVAVLISIVCPLISPEDYIREYVSDNMGRDGNV